MLEYLVGDALSGILTTAGFFIFLIIGRHFRLWKDARHRF